MRIVYDELVGAALSVKREVLGVSQKMIATSAGIPSSTLAKIELGQSSCTLSQLYQISGALGENGADLIAEIDKHLKMLNSIDQFDELTSFCHEKNIDPDIALGHDLVLTQKKPLSFESLTMKNMPVSQKILMLKVIAGYESWIPEFALQMRLTFIDQQIEDGNKELEEKYFKLTASTILSSIDLDLSVDDYFKDLLKKTDTGLKPIIKDHILQSKQDGYKEEMMTEIAVTAKNILSASDDEIFNFISSIQNEIDINYTEERVNKSKRIKLDEYFSKKAPTPSQ